MAIPLLFLSCQWPSALWVASEIFEEISDRQACSEFDLAVIITA
jgi:hypothetical protein